MTSRRFKLSPANLALIVAMSAAALAITTRTGAQRPGAARVGPADQGPRLPQRQSGNTAEGREVFRFETFGNEGFWTDAVRLPAGIEAAGVTPLQALELGLQVDSDMVDAATKNQLARELSADPSGRSSRLLNDPAVTAKLVMAGAVIGMSPKRGKVGASCALCHTLTDASVMRVPQGGSIVAGSTGWPTIFFRSARSSQPQPTRAHSTPSRKPSLPPTRARRLAARHAG